MKINPLNIQANSNAIILRSPEICEAEILLIYFRNLFHESSQYLNFSNIHYDNKTSESQESFINTFNNAPHSLVICAFLGNEIIGHIIIDSLGFERAKHRAKLVMGVLNRFHRQGIGSQLLQYAIQVAEDANVHALELQVKGFNSSAIKLYEKNNFIRIGCIPAAAYIDGEYHNEYIYQYLSPVLKALLLQQHQDLDAKHRLF